MLSNDITAILLFLICLFAIIDGTIYEIVYFASSRDQKRKLRLKQFKPMCTDRSLPDHGFQISLFTFCRWLLLRVWFFSKRKMIWYPFLLKVKIFEKGLVLGKKLFLMGNETGGNHYISASRVGLHPVCNVFWK